MILRDRLGPAQTTQPGISPASHSPRDLGPTVAGTLKVKPLLPQTMGVPPLGTLANLTLASLAGRLVVPPPGGPSPPSLLPPQAWPRLLKVAGCLSALEKHRPSGGVSVSGGLRGSDAGCKLATAKTKQEPRWSQRGLGGPLAQTFLAPPPVKPPKPQALALGA